MPANMPTYDTKRIPVGGARVFIGPISSSTAVGTPSVDVGSIDISGGVTVRLSRTTESIRQGFPAIPILRYTTEESCEVEFSGLELNPEQLRYAMGAGVTTSSSTLESYSFGGDPGVTTCALFVRHEMLQGMTTNIYVWQARGMSDKVELNFGQKPTTFPYKYEALASSVDWVGNSLNSKAALVKVEYSKA